MKKIITALVTAMLLFATPVGNFIVQDQPVTVEAKGFKGKRGGSPNSGITNFQKKQNQNRSTYNNQSTTKPRTGGFMRGLIAGGLAGILFGSLLAQWGILGSLLGLLINVGAILIIVWLVVKLFKRMNRAY